MDLAQLRKLREATNDAIEVVKERYPNGCLGPVNWADLHCTEASSVATDEANQYLQVTIEEASPDAEIFKTAVGKELSDRGWTGVVVLTEW